MKTLLGKAANAAQSFDVEKPAGGVHQLQRLSDGGVELLNR